MAVNEKKENEIFDIDLDEEIEKSKSAKVSDDEIEKDVTTTENTTTVLETEQKGEEDTLLETNGEYSPKDNNSKEDSNVLEPPKNSSDGEL